MSTTIRKIIFKILAIIFFFNLQAFALDTISIESMGLSSNIYEYNTIKKLHTGLMYDTLSEKVGSKSNVVMMGHRYSDKFGPKTNTLTNIYKIKIGDLITVTKTNGDKYTYRVFDNFNVGPYDDWSIDDHDSEEEVLTLYSCSPMWDNSYRYIVKAIRVQDVSGMPEKSDSVLRNYSTKESNKKAIFNPTTGIEPAVLYVKKGETFDVVEANKKRYKTKIYSYQDIGEYNIKGSNGSNLRVVVE